MIREIVLKVLKAQGVENPSEEVIDNAIREHLEQKVVSKWIPDSYIKIVLFKKN